jgi:hypothetical protein
MGMKSSAIFIAVGDLETQQLYKKIAILLQPSLKYFLSYDTTYLFLQFSQHRILEITLHFEALH